MPTSKHENEFSTMLESEGVISVEKSALNHSIDWIGANLDPEDVFSVIDLEKWAEANGYVKGDN